MESVETVFSRPKRNDDNIQNLESYLYNSGGRVIGKTTFGKMNDTHLKQAHRYVLLHCDDMNALCDEFIYYKRLQGQLARVNKDVQTEWIIAEFSDWLLSQVHRFDDDNGEGKLRKALAGGLSSSIKVMNGFIINSYKFHTMSRDRARKTQNSGIMVEANEEFYYGRLTNIYEVDYYGAYKVVLFQCDWVDIHKDVRLFSNGGACVNFSKLMHTEMHLRDDSFIFSSQAKQIFYVEDKTQKGWFHVIKTKPRDLFDLGEK